MADKNDVRKLNALGEGANEEVTVVFVDMGDGTYAERFVVDLPDLLTPDTFKTLKGVAIGSIATVWTPASGKKVRLMGGYISVSAAVSVLFEDNVAGTDVFQTPVLAADTPFAFDIGNGVLLGAIDNLLKATSSGAANITGTLYGIEV